RVQIMLQVLHQMYRVASDWAWHGVLESYTNLLKYLLQLDDGLHDLRVNELMNCNFGLLVILWQKAQSATRMGVHYQDRQLTQKYTEIAQELYQLQVVKDWFDSQDDSEDEGLAWFRHQLAPTQGRGTFF